MDFVSIDTDPSAATESSILINSSLKLIAIKIGKQ